MAYAALVFLDQQLQQILLQDTYIHEFPNCILFFVLSCMRKDEFYLYSKKRMESLHSNVIFLQKFLEDFPGNSSMIKHLESRITDVAYEVSDIIALDISNPRYKNMMNSCISAFSSIHEDAKEIRKTGVLGLDYWRSSSSSTIAAPSNKNTTVGLEINMIQMNERILGRNSALQIIPITGMGGIGKTTLAKNVYEDPAVVAHFDVCVWVTVSQGYNAKNILKEILGKAKDAEEEVEENVGSLIVGVHKKLRGRRFLIIVDDIWSIKAWDSVRNAFPDDKKGSRIVITTRLTEVAIQVGSASPLHEMQLMDRVQSWELFQKEAFGQECCPSQLENIGITISEACKGLPLAIAVIARLLKLNRTQYYWEKFARNMHQDLAETTSDDQIMKILSLSYENLPPHLKACFLSTSMFPEDKRIPAENMKRLWVAEGFLKPTTDKCVEDVAEKCLLDLVDRNLLSAGRRDSIGNIESCTVHDLMRDLSLKKANEDKFSQQIITSNTGKVATGFTKMFFQEHMGWSGDQTGSRVILHRRGVGVNNPAALSFFRANKSECDYVYSFIYHDDEIDYKEILPKMRSKLVRVVDVPETVFDRSMSFGVNLRYLSFSYGGDYYDLNITFTKIAKLQNLETLVMYHDPFPQKYLYFPILEMPKLKHFVLDRAGVVDRSGSNYCLFDNRDFVGHLEWNLYRDPRPFWHESLPTELTQLVASVSKKSQLRTLSRVRNIEWTVDAVKIFANLVTLNVTYDSNTIDECCLDNFVNLHQLEKLGLCMEGYCRLPANTSFPHKLKEIALYHVKIWWKNVSMMGCLPSLQSLELEECRFETDEWIPVEGEFQQLRYLKMHDIELEEWRVESIHFPCLEQLIISKCQYLREVPAEVGEIESLQKLVIRECMACVRDSAWEIQEVQRSYDNYDLQVIVEESMPDTDDD